MEFVTLQGRTHYVPFDIFKQTLSKNFKYSSNDAPRLKEATSSYVVSQSLLPYSYYNTKSSVCEVSFQSIHPDLITGHHLLLNQEGEFKYVQTSNIHSVYDVHYYNASVRKMILLGRFLHPDVASLAHWIARTSDDDNMRLVPFAAQSHIESLHQQSVFYLGTMDAKKSDVDAWCDEMLSQLL